MAQLKERIFSKAKANIDEAQKLVQLYRPAIKDGTLMVTAEPVQQQSGAVDCGGFSTAFALCSAGKRCYKVETQAEDARAPTSMLRT